MIEELLKKMFLELQFVNWRKAYHVSMCSGTRVIMNILGIHGSLIFPDIH
jgi:hypothetical protein